MRGKSRFNSVEELIATFSPNEQQIAREVFKYANGLEDVYYYISDGIMLKRNSRKFKFLSITTVGNRILFHFPIKMRDDIFEQYKDKLNIYTSVNPKRDKNQINIALNDIGSLDSVKELIDLAYIERE